ncbi:hypothetical protein BT69DRAFT_1364265 [Atractiella rhizophila]|nr:hypothetical protein BT69DRAFT_1364265 [Atractiella rhizophila]
MDVEEVDSIEGAMIGAGEEDMEGGAGDVVFAAGPAEPYHEKIQVPVHGTSLSPATLTVEGAEGMVIASGGGSAFLGGSGVDIAAGAGGGGGGGAGVLDGGVAGREGSPVAAGPLSAGLTATPVPVSLFVSFASSALVDDGSHCWKGEEDQGPERIKECILTKRKDTGIYMKMQYLGIGHAPQNMLATGKKQGTRDDHTERDRPAKRKLLQFTVWLDLEVSGGALSSRSSLVLSLEAGSRGVCEDVLEGQAGGTQKESAASHLAQEVQCFLRRKVTSHAIQPAHPPIRLPTFSVGSKVEESATSERESRSGAAGSVAILGGPPADSGMKVVGRTGKLKEYAEGGWKTKYGK